jgi:hypothetical protein
MRQHHPLKVRVVLSFVPKRHGAARASASTTVSFKR